MSRPAENTIPSMVGESTLQGYLLEEALAWLLRNTGYRLLVDASQDPDELAGSGEILRVRGRGAQHQVDVLGQFPLTPAFSLPIRMFLEAKFRDYPCDLSSVRNAHGVIHDVNEHFAWQSGSHPRRRYLYTYALFSTSGFTRAAQSYALAKQISLVDYAQHHPTHEVRLIRSGRAEPADWTASPLGSPDAYRLTFTLPDT